MVPSDVVLQALESAREDSIDSAAEVIREPADERFPDASIQSKRFPSDVNFRTSGRSRRAVVVCFHGDVL
ncbi:hypothetical protein KOR42_25400 [Thalassoglobus neptunius]|uniref:Uncharacterized protein n=1 Tax=Thalassoglobus neptunius TaxID=1938619 RepID=A0A5C5X9T0_9PLAN|nr:hypothetical protein KOR42_25400 [Thalassoglobus neptunius]